ncbi:FAD-binding monooxygenase [Streptomyces platensis]|uniref:FAD-binding monooxygenase n=1 Tax=Streptomyces platensis TaxID=58346 RepID=A0AAE6TQU5_STRPT|nr:FAD-dependent monooxygenase [Streptomyces platensis]OSY48328.1 Pentachlorophenol 4-monooxygenase [Streptomyces platensis]QEV56040.1 FAD-binding monooxygenase [Streptomyces platensis]
MKPGAGRPAEVYADVCIVGGGPAGLTLALLMLRSGARVALVERSRSLEREYRGEILQPGGQELLATLGVLEGARERGCHEHDGFRLEEHGRVLIDGNYRRLPGTFNCLLSLPQRHLLTELLRRCQAHPGFVSLTGTRVNGLVEEASAVRGVVCSGTGSEPDTRVVRAACVVGADGRYSTVRRLARIPYDRVELFDQDVLWFKLAARATRTVRIFRAGGSPVLAYTSFPDQVQLGWTLPHRGYRELASRGFGEVKDRIRAAVPEYADAVEEQIGGFKDLSLLDVFAGSARQWARDGLLLIGDSAHTHSPIGAQGINLAVQDAVAAHPVLCEGLRRRDLSARMLAPLVAQRQDETGKMTRLQVMQSRMMLSSGRLSGFVRPKAALLVSRTPAYRSVLRRIAYGDRGVAVRSDLFHETETGPA